MSSHEISASAKAPEDVRAVIEHARTCTLTSVSSASAPRGSGAGPIVVCVARDELSILPDFLRHYRAMGVRRFVFVDNGSRDGSASFLASQPDVDLYVTREAFHWRAKQGWITKLLAGFPDPQWFICVDADEHLMFDDAERKPVSALVDRLSERGLRRARGLLIDMYAPGPIAAAPAMDGAPLLERFAYFDAEGYAETPIRELISCIGGPRMRAFGAIDPEFKPQLTKYPIFQLAPGEVMANPHHLWPTDANFTAPRVVALLHFKFHAAAIGRISEAVAARSYWSDSLEYRCYAAGLRATPDMALLAPCSRRFSRSRDLVDARLIEEIDWPAGDTVGETFEAMRQSARAAALARSCGHGAHADGSR